MSTDVLCIAFLAVVSLALVGYWRASVRRHQRRLRQLDTRVHVNGIRGKSTVTRLIAGVLREGGFVTVAKTTGSAARVIDPRGHEHPIRRWGAPTINEQVEVVREWVGPAVEALVIECMAVRPLYQQYSQEFMVRSDLTVITNVREDHQEEMGETLEEIADSMARTIPRGGVLITAEERPHLRERLARHAADRGSRMVHADPAGVSDAEMTGFDHLQFKSNVAIGLAVADHLGIDRRTALEGMWRSVPDVGVVRLRTYDVHGKQITWVPMFAANDRESVVLTFDTLTAQFPPGATVIGLLNNRADRGRRAELFATMVPADLAGHLDHVITMGAYEDTVIPIMTAGGYPQERITRLGDTVRPTPQEVLRTIAGLVPGEHGVLVGMINIHTEQAEQLIHHFAGLDGEHVDELQLSRDPSRAPAPAQHLALTRARLRALTAAEGSSGA